MEKFIKLYSSLIPLVLISLYTIGYTYYFTFYGYLGISIEYYISLSDLIFYSINVLITMLVLFFLGDGIFAGLFGFLADFIFIPLRILIWKFKRKKKISYFKIEAKYKNLFVKKWVFIFYQKIWIIIVFALAFYTLISKDPFFKPYYLSVALIPLKFFLIESTKNKKETGSLKDVNKLIIVSFLVSLLVIFFLGRLDSELIKGGTNSKEIKIIMDEEDFSTQNSKLIFIGETSNYIFLFDLKKIESLALSKNDISIIKTKPLKRSDN